MTLPSPAVPLTHPSSAWPPRRWRASSGRDCTESLLPRTLGSIVRSSQDISLWAWGRSQVGPVSVGAHGI